MTRLAALAACFLLAPAAFSSAAELRSPDGRIVVTVGVKERLDPYPSGPRLYYSVAFRGKAILLDSPLGLDFADAAPLARGLVVEKETPRSFDTTWERVAGKSRQVRDHGNELTLDLVESAAPARRLQVVFRAYDDGVAFRYVLPEQPGLGAFRLAAERTEFRFAGNHTAWAAPYGSFTTSPGGGVRQDDARRHHARVDHGPAPAGAGREGHVRRDHRVRPARLGGDVPLGPRRRGEHARLDPLAAAGRPGAWPSGEDAAPRRPGAS